MKKIKGYDCVIVDEAQFCNKSQIELFVHIVDDLNIPVICYGLRADFKNELFEGYVASGMGRCDRRNKDSMLVRKSLQNANARYDKTVSYEREARLFLEVTALI